MELNWTPKTIRIRKEKKQVEVANYLGLSLRQYKRKENDYAKWYAHELLLLSKLYDVNAEIFFDSIISQKLQKIKKGELNWQKTKY